MPRATVQDRVKAATELAGYLDYFGPELAARMEERFAPEPDTLVQDNSGQDNSGQDNSGRKDGLGGILRGLRREILAAQEELIERDEEHGRHIRRGQGLRRQRDEAVKALRADLLQARQTIGAMGKATGVIQVLGLQGRTSEDPVALLRQARRAMSNLRTAPPESEWKKRLEALTLDLPKLADQIQPAADGLDSALQAVRSARQDQHGTLLAKDLAAEALDALVKPAQRWLEALAPLAGRPGLATYVTAGRKAPGRPRRRRKAAKPSTQPSPGPSELSGHPDPQLPTASDTSGNASP